MYWEQLYPDQELANIDLLTPYIDIIYSRTILPHLFPHLPHTGIHNC